MKKKIIFFTTLTVAITSVLVAIIVIIQSFSFDSNCKKRVYADIEEKINEDTLSSVISFLCTESEDNVVNYYSGNTGVVVGFDNEKYYAITALHVISGNEEIRVFPYGELSYMDYRKTNGAISYAKYFDLFPSFKVEKEDEDSDLALISFEYDKDLSIAKLSTENASKNTRIVSIGCPEGELFTKTYGKITSSKEVNFKSSDGIETMCYSHNCYIAPGSSGSPVLNEDLELIGINIGGTTNNLGNFVKGYFVSLEHLVELISFVRK